MARMNTTQKIRDNLARRLQAFSLNQLEAANRIGVSQSMLSLFLSGKRGLNGESMLKVLNFLQEEIYTSPPTPPEDRP